MLTNTKCLVMVLLKKFTFGHVLVQFMIVWHLKTEKGSFNLFNLSPELSSLESIIHL